MNAPAIAAVLFDFDGTLAPNLDLPDMRRQVIELTRDAGVPDDAFAGHYIVEIIGAAHAWLRPRDAAGADRYQRSAHRLITDFELAAAAHTRVFPGIPELLDRLAAAGIRLGVVTRNCRAAVLQVFPELLEHVHALRARDDTDYLKPDPRHLQSCLQALDCAPRASAMVGDGALDMRVGRALDMYCVGVLSGSSDRDALHEAGAHEVIEHCLDLSF